ncbi:MAG: hypothetical protein AAGG07_09225 [Planctomycetota bacterium]
MKTRTTLAVALMAAASFAGTASAGLTNLPGLGELAPTPGGVPGLDGPALDRTLDPGQGTTPFANRSVAVPSPGPMLLGLAGVGAVARRRR